MKSITLRLVFLVLLFSSCSPFWSLHQSNMYNKNTGNVGIGTNLPMSKLTVIEESQRPTSTDPNREIEFYALYSEINSNYKSSAIYGASGNTGGYQNYGGYFINFGSGSGVRGVVSGNNNDGGTGGSFVSHGRGGSGVVGIAGYSGKDDTGGFGGQFNASGERGVGIKARGGKNGYAAQFIGNVQIANREGEAIIELGEGLDIAEGFNVNENELSILEPGMVLVLDENNPGELTISKKQYDNKVAGVVAGGNELGSGIILGGNKFDTKVALIGRVYVNVDASQSSVLPGDLLTTSNIPGFAMKVLDYEKARGSILGKAIEPLMKGETGQILVLVTLQ